jgi:hypothetical protein
MQQSTHFIQMLAARERFLDLASFKDDSSALASQLSSWVRLYAKYLEERVSCTAATGCDVEREATGLRGGHEGTQQHSMARTWSSVELLAHLPRLQRLLRRLMACCPDVRSPAASDRVVAGALNLVVRESLKLYRALYDGVVRRPLRHCSHSWFVELTRARQHAISSSSTACSMMHCREERDTRPSAAHAHRQRREVCACRLLRREGIGTVGADQSAGQILRHATRRCTHSSRALQGVHAPGESRFHRLCEESPSLFS